MGLIKAFTSAVGGTLGDSWKEGIHCPEIDNTVILRKGTKISSGSSRTSNTKGTDNVISNGSKINVPENVCMLTVDNGKITNIVTEPGQYTYDSSSAPSIFAGQIMDSLKDALSRFTFGGTPAFEQQVVYINLQELPGIKYGTSKPVPYPDPRYNTTVEIGFYGTFAIKIPDALHAVQFYKEVAGKGTSSDDIDVVDIFGNEQYKTEFMTVINQALNMLAGQGVSYNMIASQGIQLLENVKSSASPLWEPRGFTISNIGINPPTLSAKSQELLKDRLWADTMSDDKTLKAFMAGKVGSGIEKAGGNPGGAMVGFAGFDMANQAGGNILNSFGPTQPQSPQPVQPQAPAENTWKCECGADNTGRFCHECGKPKPDASPADGGWKCEKCGAQNSGKFCAECGAQRPSASKYSCNKCGWNPPDPANPPKFCPECGDKFNEEDKI